MPDPSAERKLSFYYKLTRANHHLSDLRREIKAWLHDAHEATVLEPDPDDARYFFLKVTAKQPDERFGLIIGDCVQNMRSVLDHMAYALAEAHTVPFTDTVARASQFPIVGDENRQGEPNSGANIFRDTQERRIGGIHPEAQKVIQGFQPYHRGKDFRDHPLWLLGEWSNIDKHRLLHTTIGSWVGLKMHVVESGGYWFPWPQPLKVFRGTVDGEAVIARIELVPGTLPRPPEHGFQDQVKFSAPLVIALEETEPAWSGEHDVLKKLTEVYEFIRTEVLPALVPFL